MKVRHLIFTLLLLPSLFLSAFADKGMWVLQELNKQNIERMKELGFTMPIDQLYNLKNPSLANAVVIFGRGCTGVTVSDKGLIFTNHHCGYGAIQSQSTVEHDYLQDGFASMSEREELPIPGLTVSYLKDMIEVTARVEKEVKGITDEMDRAKKISVLSAKIEEEYSKGDFQVARMVPFYEGNKYYVIVYNVFRDVRLVMTPPSSVGKFGGDTDNWMWPRHTGDFSVFRVYADKNNKPAAYSKDNKPYKPVYYAKVSLNGYKPGDYAMTIGFPGSTNRYLTSWAIEDLMQNEHNPRIEVRGAKQDIWKKAMDADQATRIKYASKYASSSNYWKNAIGMNLGVQKLNLLARKEAEQKAFTEWIKTQGKESQYGNILPELQQGYKEIGALSRKLNYLYESLMGGAELPMLTSRVMKLAKNKDLSSNEAKTLLNTIQNSYKDYSPELDQKVLPTMLDLMRKNGGEEILVDLYKQIDEQFAGSTTKYTENLFAQSIIPSEAKVLDLLKLSADKRNKQLKKDPAVALWTEIYGAFIGLRTNMSKASYNIDKNKRIYFAAMREMNPQKLMPSDANFTMRMSYGSVGGYIPKDGAYYNYYTTQKGIFEKQNPNVGEFRVQPEILELLRKGDFGEYGVRGNLQLCFLSGNDITGGNSGSPVFDKNGDLIGLAFDGNWEAMSGDLEFEPELQRTINVDIRYVLFMIDKWANCKRLVQELTFAPKVKTCCGKGHCKKAMKEGGCCKAKMQGKCPKQTETKCKSECPKAKVADCPKATDSKCAKKCKGECPKTKAEAYDKELDKKCTGKCKGLCKQNPNSSCKGKCSGKCQKQTSKAA